TGRVEGLQKDLVGTVPSGENLKNKFAGGVSLELDLASGGIAGVEYQADAQRRPVALQEVSDGLALAVFEDLEILLGEVNHRDAALVEDRHRHVHHLNADADLAAAGRGAGFRRIGGRRILVSGRRILSGSRWGG